jgi:hypothetical protein
VTWKVLDTQLHLHYETIFNRIITCTKQCSCHSFKKKICIAGGGIKVHSTPRPPMAYCASPGWLWWWRNRWNNWQGKPNYSEKTCPSAALSTTNPTCCPYANPGRRGGKPASNRLSYGTAFHSFLSRSLLISSSSFPFILILSIMLFLSLIFFHFYSFFNPFHYLLLTLSRVRSYAWRK